VVTIEQIVQEILELRLRRDRADAHLLCRLVEIEAEYMQLIIDSGCSSFGQFLRSMKNVVEPGRYLSFKAGLARIGVESALAIGSDATIVAGQLSVVPSAPDEYTRACRAWVDEHSGVRPTQRTAKHLLLQVDPRTEVPESVRKQDEIARLRAEVSQLKAENAALKRRVRELEDAASKRRR
jgi:hypothetical protein